LEFERIASKEKKELAPGEDKILAALTEKPRSFTELKNETVLPGSVLADYLKRLQEKDLIQRDFKTRKYEIKEKQLVTKTVNDFYKNFKTLEKFVSRYASDPDKLFRLRMMLTQNPNDKVFEKGFMTLQEIEDLRQPMDETLEPLKETLKDIIKIFLEIELPFSWALANRSLEKVTVNFSKEGEPLWRISPLDPESST